LTGNGWHPGEGAGKGAVEQETWVDAERLAGRQWLAPNLAERQWLTPWKRGVRSQDSAGGW